MKTDVNIETLHQQAAGETRADHKERFHREASRLLRDLKTHLGCEGRVVSSRGGIAVMGEVYLDTQHFHLEVLGETYLLSDANQEQVMYRRPVSGSNHWATLKQLVDGDLDETLRRWMEA